MIYYKTSKIRTKNIEESFIYYKPLNKYICPLCMRDRKKYVKEYYFKDGKVSSIFLDDPVCAFCFEVVYLCDVIDSHYGVS